MLCQRRNKRGGFSAATVRGLFNDDDGLRWTEAAFQMMSTELIATLSSTPIFSCPHGMETSDLSGRVRSKGHARSGRQEVQACSSRILPASCACESRLDTAASERHVVNTRSSSGRNGAQAHVVAVARANCPSHSWTGRLASCYSLGQAGC